MTTIFGVRHEDVDMVVLGADRQGTFLSKGEKTPVRKLIIVNNDYVIGTAGTMTDEFYGLVSKMKKGAVDVQKIIAEKKFPELREVNVSGMGDTLPNLDNLASMLLATRFGNDPRLYTCWPMGRVEPRGLTYVGSGSKYVQEYLRTKEVGEALTERSSVGPVMAKDLVEFVLYGVKYASIKDLGSSGLDMVVVTPNEIRDHGKELLDNTFKRRLKDIQKQYKK